MKELIFVYKADSGLFNMLTDFAHKIISPSTYACQLCALTHGSFTIKKEWKEFIETLPLNCTFLHRNEFEKEYQMQIELPVIFFKDDKGLLLLLSQKEIDNCQTLYALQQLITTQLTSYDQHHHTHL